MLGSIVVVLVVFGLLVWSLIWAIKQNSKNKLARSEAEATARAAAAAQKEEMDKNIAVHKQSLQVAKDTGYYMGLKVITEKHGDITAPVNEIVRSYLLKDITKAQLRSKIKKMLPGEEPEYSEELGNRVAGRAKTFSDLVDIANMGCLCFEYRGSEQHARPNCIMMRAKGQRYFVGSALQTMFDRQQSPLDVVDADPLLPPCGPSCKCYVAGANFSPMIPK